MIKVNLIDENTVMYINPDHIATFSTQNDGSTYISTKDNNGWHISDSAESLNAQILAWQHRIMP